MSGLPLRQTMVRPPLWLPVAAWGPNCEEASCNSPANGHCNSIHWPLTATMRVESTFAARFRRLLLIESSASSNGLDWG